ncbi:MAG: hypothetical protein OIF36_00720 [Alphaproteobacteria bacterium]|nr:hypothetical protein [Alphaproteobacteria bacterium]
MKFILKAVYLILLFICSTVSIGLFVESIVSIFDEITLNSFLDIFIAFLILTSCIITSFRFYKKEKLITSFLFVSIVPFFAIAIIRFNFLVI